jgi:UDP-N-acetylmuramoyl-L-alanyl-D-glutamate--2,6-diaminopimelate ligase
MSANFYGHPSHNLRLIGVTGTNGKTTTAYLMSWLLENSGLIGTIEYHTGKGTIRATHTTPESLELNQLLSQMVEQGCRTAVMEVSSHAAHQHRVDGMTFEAAIFTNLTQDHLDYHGTMERYLDAKKMLFDMLPASATAVTNVDDKLGLAIVKDSRARRLTYAVETAADVRATDIELSIGGTKFVAVHRNENTPLESSLIGKFNVYNILAGFSGGVALGLSKKTLREKIAGFKSVRGRFERIRAPGDFTVIIDYAHTPDALTNCLQTIHGIFHVDPASQAGRIITVFGCGGNRDRGKRPTMAKIATQLSAITIVTSDNPRDEDPEAIIDEVMTGALPGAVAYRQADRQTAIGQALDLARAGDVVLIAGKGHETEQIIGNQRTHFSDREVVEKILRATER